MANLEIQELRWRYLEKLYELSEAGLYPEVDYKQVQTALGYSREQTSSIVDYLESKDLVSFKCRVPCIRITTRGIDEVEAAMQKSYAEKMRAVLEKIYEMSGPPYTNEVSYFALQRELGMNARELNPILKDFTDRRGWLGECSDECVCLSPEGVLEVENSRVERHSRGGDIYQTHIHGPNYGGIQQGTYQSTQNITNNQPISEILPKLAELIAAVRQADFEDHEEVVKDLEKVEQLAQSEDPKSKWALIQSKLTSAKTAMEIVGFSYKTLPYWPLIWQYFFG